VFVFGRKRNRAFGRLVFPKIGGGATRLSGEGLEALAGTLRAVSDNAAPEGQMEAKGMVMTPRTRSFQG
jgi:hypothetical protein